MEEKHDTQAAGHRWKNGASVALLGSVIALDLLLVFNFIPQSPVQVSQLSRAEFAGGEQVAQTASKLSGFSLWWSVFEQSFNIGKPKQPTLLNGPSNPIDTQTAPSTPPTEQNSGSRGTYSGDQTPQPVGNSIGEGVNPINNDTSITVQNSGSNKPAQSTGNSVARELNPTGKTQSTAPADNTNSGGNSNSTGGGSSGSTNSDYKVENWSNDNTSGNTNSTNGTPGTVNDFGAGTTDGGAGAFSSYSGGQGTPRDTTRVPGGDGYPVTDQSTYENVFHDTGTTGQSAPAAQQDATYKNEPGSGYDQSGGGTSGGGSPDAGGTGPGYDLSGGPYPPQEQPGLFQTIGNAVSNAFTSLGDVVSNAWNAITGSRAPNPTWSEQNSNPPPGFNPPSQGGSPGVVTTGSDSGDPVFGDGTTPGVNTTMSNSNDEAYQKLPTGQSGFGDPIGNNVGGGPGTTMSNDSGAGSNGFGDPIGNNVGGGPGTTMSNDSGAGSNGFGSYSGSTGGNTGYGFDGNSTFQDSSGSFGGSGGSGGGGGGGSVPGHINTYDEMVVYNHTPQKSSSLLASVIDAVLNFFGFGNADTESSSTPEKASNSGKTTSQSLKQRVGKEISMNEVSAMRSDALNGTKKMVVVYKDAQGTKHAVAVGYLDPSGKYMLSLNTVGNVRAQYPNTQLVRTNPLSTSASRFGTSAAYGPSAPDLELLCVRQLQGMNQYMIDGFGHTWEYAMKDPASNCSGNTLSSSTRAVVIDAQVYKNSLQFSPTERAARAESYLTDHPNSSTSTKNVMNNIMTLTDAQLAALYGKLLDTVGITSRLVGATSTAQAGNR